MHTLGMNWVTRILVPSTDVDRCIAIDSFVESNCALARICVNSIDANTSV